MYRKAQSNIILRGQKQSAFVLIFCVCLIAAAFLSTAFIVSHFGHEHEHNGVHDTCAVCIQIKSAENMLKQLGVSASGAVVLLAGVFAAVSIRAMSSDTVVFNPVTLKIRMNY